MFLLVVQDVAALAERREVPRMVVHRIVVKVRSRQNHARCAGSLGAAWCLQACYRPSLAIAPGVPLLIPPVAITEVLNRPCRVVDRNARTCPWHVGTDRERPAHASRSGKARDADGGLA